MATERTPVFELHIAPMFRWVDREHMNRTSNPIDLADYASVRANADTILFWLKKPNDFMPMRHTGGPWPQEWISLFERWMKRYHRLVPGTGTNYALRKDGNDFRLSCDAEFPDRDARCWFELESKAGGAGKLTYVLVLETTLDAQLQSRTKQVKEIVPGPLATPSIYVRDSAANRA